MSQAVYETQPRNVLLTTLFFGFTLVLALLFVGGMLWLFLRPSSHEISWERFLPLLLLLPAFLSFKIGFGKYNLKKVALFRNKLVIFNRLSQDIEIPSQSIAFVDYEYFPYKQTYALRLEVQGKSKPYMLKTISAKECFDIYEFFGADPAIRELAARERKGQINILRYYGLPVFWGQGNYSAGVLIPLISLCVCMFALPFISQFKYGLGEGVALGAILGGIILGFVAQRLTRPEANIEPKTGLPSRDIPRHSLYFIPLKGWAFIWVAGGCWGIFRLMT